MRILADENLDSPIVTWLRAQGHDVLWAAETLSGMDDEGLCHHAATGDRIIVTRDRDFGRLVYRQGIAVPGVLLLRVTAPSADERLPITFTSLHLP